MYDTFVKDVHNCMDALEDYIIRREEELLGKNASDREWMQLDAYKATMKNLQFIESIYG